MNPKDKKAYIERYDKRVSEWGVSPESLGWSGGLERQQQRFQAAIDFTIFSENQVLTVLDVGCGFGDFGAWLKEKYPEIHYVGVDINYNLVSLGRKRNDLDLTTDEIETFDSQSFDLVVANGIFNFRMENESHESYVQQMIARLLDVARVGIAVDFMSTFVDFQHQGAFHCPEELVIAAVKQSTKRYVIRNDYLDHEYMVYAYL
jgi:trans-aconitate methyltransferase